MTDYTRIRRQVVFDVLDRFPNHGNRTLAKKIYAESPEFFDSEDHARSILRYYRGASGNRDRSKLKDKRYVKPVQPS